MSSYPLAGTLAARIRSSSEEELIEWLGAAVHFEGAIPASGAEYLPPGAIVGRRTWRIELEGGPVVASARFAPLADQPDGLLLLFQMPFPAASLRDRLRELGTPLPVSDPTGVVGKDALGFRVTRYLPGPGGLYHLSFSTIVQAGTLMVLVELDWDEPEDAPSWIQGQGTLYWRTEEDVRALKANRILPPGSAQARRLV